MGVLKESCDESELVDMKCTRCGGRHKYPAIRAAGKGCEACINALPREALETTDSKGITTLHVALQHGHLGCAELLRRLTSLAIDVADNSGKTPAHYAAHAGQINSLVWIQSDYARKM